MKKKKKKKKKLSFKKPIRDISTVTFKDNHRVAEHYHEEKSTSKDPYSDLPIEELSLVERLLFKKIKIGKRNYEVVSLVVGVILTLALAVFFSMFSDDIILLLD